MHGENNYPFAKARSDLDIALPDGADDQYYLAQLDVALDMLFVRFDPQLIIYLAGADPYEGDRLGRLALTMDGLAQRDRTVLNAAKARGLPVAIAMAGGYGRSIDETVAIHLQTLRIASDYLIKQPASLMG
jgi:acetoin utilization deacetylase AcuC-like enzyme